MNKEQIKSFVEANPHLISKKKTSLPGIYVLKYKNKCFYKGIWTPEIQECRGTVIDEDYNIISRPFTKVFNYQEQGTRIDRDEPVIAVQKINGFLGVATIYKGELLVSTTGSIDSDYAKLARKWIEPKSQSLLTGFTYLFEIVDKSDPHIIDEKEGAYLIGINTNEWDVKSVQEDTLDFLAKKSGFKRPEWGYYSSFQQLKDEIKTVKHEGFMVYGLDYGTVLKLKSPYYLTTKFLARMRDEKLVKMLDNPELLMQKIDEEFYSVIDYINQDLNSFLDMNEQQRVKYLREYFDKGMQ